MNQGWQRAAMSRCDIVFVGHLAWNRDRTPHGDHTAVGGSALYCALGTCVGDPHRVGVVAPIGRDFDVAPLRRLGVDCTGVRVFDGRTPRFVITQRPDGGRDFRSLPRWVRDDAAEVREGRAAGRQPFPQP